MDSSKRLLELGLRRWDDSGLLLIPGLLLDLVPDGTRLKDIAGKTVVKGKDALSRKGLLACGVMPGQYAAAAKWFENLKGTYRSP